MGLTVTFITFIQITCQSLILSTFLHYVLIVHANMPDPDLHHRIIRERAIYIKNQTIIQEPARAPLVFK